MSNEKDCQDRTPAVMSTQQTMGTNQIPPPGGEKTFPHPSTHSNHSQSSTTLSPHNHPVDSHSTKPKRSLATRLDHACLNLSPSFFSLNMGTGIASILLYNLPYNATWLQRIGIVIFILNIVLFAIISTMSIVRYIRWKGIFATLNTHCLAGLYWGCLPMGLVTIINMVAFVCVPAWGYNWAKLALGLWWIDVIISALASFGMMFMMFARQEHTPQTVSAALLLPVVAPVVAAASGGVIAEHLMPFNPRLAFSTVVCSYVVWGTGVPVAMFIITIWMYRTIVQGMPAAMAMPSLFLPLGPCGQGSFGIILLGRVIRELANNHSVGVAANLDTESMLRIADAIYAGGIVTGLVLWGLGLVWYTLAMVMTLDHGFRNIIYFAPKSFSIGWTAYTFPIGVWATATTILASELDSPAFKVIGTIVSLQVVFQWLYVFIMTCWKAYQGTIFVAPELAKWDGKPPLRWSKAQPMDIETCQNGTAA